MRLLLFMFLAVFSPAAAAAQDCHADTVRNGEGVLLVLSSGWSFKLFPGDDRLAGSWCPLEKVTVCHLSGAAYRITNLSRQGQQVEGLYQF
jgi:hypothetical protein